MNIFKVVRLSIWSLVLAVGIVVAATYFAVSQTFLSTASLNRILEKSQLADTIRTEILLPKVLQNTRGSDFASLLDDKTVTQALNTTVSTSVLNKKLEPAVDSLQKWLNSQEPTIAFSIDMSDLSTKFADELSGKIDEKVAALPRCNLRNTLAEAEAGICRSSLVTTESLTKKINEVIKSDAALENNTKITPDSIKLSPSIQQKGSDLPTYLNIFYAVAIVAAGVALFITLWLLYKHRLAGIISIGASLVVAGVGLFVISVIGTQMIGTFSTDPQVQQIARAGSNALEATLQQTAIPLLIVGIILILLGTLAKVLVNRRSHPKQSLHLSSS